jgi:trigger factor
MFAGDSDTKFRNEVRKTLLNRLSLSLPDKFLKRWIISINEKPITPQQVEEEYPTYSDQLKWQLIENKILKENEIKISSDEAIEYVKELVRAEYMKMGRTDVSDNELAEVSKRVLEKEEEAKKIFDQLYDRRLLQLYKEKCTLEPKEVSYEEFVTI